MEAANPNPHLGRVFSSNPCFTGDMKLLTEDGYQTFSELDGQYVNIINVDGEITKGKVWCTGEKEVISLHFSNGSIIKCTPNHVFLTIDEEECQAKDLLHKMPMPFASYKSGNFSKDKAPSVCAIKKIGQAIVYDVSEPQKHWGVVNGFIVHNCGEFVSIPWSSCNLSSLNLSNFADGSRVKDWNWLNDRIALAVRFLDDMISVNNLPLQEITEVTKNLQGIGLGTMGLADLLYQLGIRYDSEEFRIVEKMPAVKFEVVEFFEDHDRGGFGSTGKS